MRSRPSPTSTTQGRANVKSSTQPVGSGRDGERDGGARRRISGHPNTKPPAHPARLAASRRSPGLTPPPPPRFPSRPIPPPPPARSPRPARRKPPLPRADPPARPVLPCSPMRRPAAGCSPSLSRKPLYLPHHYERQRLHRGCARRHHFAVVLWIVQQETSPDVAI